MHRAVYDITVTPKYDRPTSVECRPVQKVQVLVAGSPDAPQIWTRRSRHHHCDGAGDGGDDEAVIEWSEPRLSGVKVAGYQVYVNGKKTDGLLASNHRKAIIPLKGKRSVPHHRVFGFLSSSSFSFLRYNYIDEPVQFARCVQRIARR